MKEDENAAAASEGFGVVLFRSIVNMMHDVRPNTAVHVFKT